MAAYNAYLIELWKEASRRGYNFGVYLVRNEVKKQRQRMLPLDSESKKSSASPVVQAVSGQSGAVGKDKVTVWKKRVFSGLMLALIFGMGFLLLRENEGRTAAEEKLKQAQQGIDALMSDKNNTIDELQSQIDELTGKYSELTEQFNAMVVEKDGEIAKGNEERQKQAAAHEAVIAQKETNYKELEARTKGESLKLNQMIESKSSEIGDLGAQIEALSGKYSEALKKKEALEGANLKLESQVTTLGERIKILEQEKQALAASLESMKQEAAGVKD